MPETVTFRNRCGDAIAHFKAIEIANALLEEGLRSYYRKLWI